MSAIITLNADLVETPSRYNTASQAKLENLQREITYQFMSKGVDYNQRSKRKMDFIRTLDVADGTEYHTNYLGVLAYAYSMHIPVTLNPHDVWYLLLTEYAHIVSENVEACRPLFTKSKEKIHIVVDSGFDAERIDLNLIVAQLRDLVPVDMDQFLPEFSNITPEARYACVAAFADTVSHYYSYGMLCCGLPSVKLGGTVEDWQMIIDRNIAICEMFAQTGTSLHTKVGMWQSRVNGIIIDLIETYKSGDPTFLKDIFTMENLGSGGDKRIDGWFADLYYRTDGGRKLRGGSLANFPSSISKVEYINHDTNRVFTGLHGCFSSAKDEDGFLTARYGEIITEILDVETGKPVTENKYPDLKIEKITVEGKSRTLDGLVHIGESVTMSMHNPDLAGSMRVYVDPEDGTPVTRREGSGGIDTSNPAGLYNPEQNGAMFKEDGTLIGFLPYIPLTPAAPADTGTFDPKVSFKTRYGVIKKED